MDAYAIMLIMESIRDQKLSNRLPLWGRLAAALSAAWSMQHAYGLPAADRAAGIADVLLVAALYLLFTQYGSMSIERRIRVRAAWTAVAFVLVSAACGGWFSILRYEHFTDPLFYTCYYINAFVGQFLLYYAAVAMLLQKLVRLNVCAVPQGSVAARARRAFWIALGVCALVYFVFLLNQYPGSMESDHMRQLKSVLEARYDNRNPLINSLTVLGCVRLVQAFGGTINGGVFLYSVVQLLLLAGVFAFGVSLTVRAGFPRAASVAVTLFYALVPYNIFYSYGMWKDSFFAAWLILTVFLVWRVLLHEQEGERVSARWFVLLGFSALMASLSRNSGWSALLCWTPVLFCMLRGFAVRGRTTASVGLGVALALLLMGPVYSALGVDKTADSITVSCIPLQQVGAVIQNGKQLSAQETELIERVASVEKIRAQYDPACADPMKDLLYPGIAQLDANRSAYVRLWLSLGIRYPMTYVRAYLAQVRMYIDPNVSSETAYKWIYANDFGVYRDPKLLPNMDFGYYESLLELPAVNLLKRPGAILWAIVILWQLCALRGNPKARLFYVPLLAVLFGLFLTVPVALFRYVYSIAACIPLLCLWPFWDVERHALTKNPSE